MKRTTIIAMMLAAAITMMLCGCSSEEMLFGIASESKTVPISVTDAGFVSAVGKQTRTAEDGVKTTFSKDDAIGIYVTDGTKLICTNLKYTYDDATSSWTNTTYGAYVPYVAGGGKYFAYYPYRDTYTEATSATDVTANATTPEAFFAPIITAWTPATDQSTHANYTAQDLMVAQGSFATDHYTFSLAHQMALVEVDFAQEKFIVDGGEPYKYGFDTYQPYNIEDGKYRMLVKPGDANMSIGGKIYATPTAQTGVWSFAETSPDKAKCKVYTLDGKSASLSNSYAGVEVGQIYYNDGTCSSQDYDANNTTRTPIGVVVSTNSTYCEPTADNGKYGHGLVMALKDASTGATWGLNRCDETLDDKGNLVAYYNDASGLANTNVIKNAHQSSTTFDTDYPAFYAAINYNKDLTLPTGCSGWFLPSIGQWWDALEKAAAYNGTSLGLSEKHNDSSEYYGSDETTIAVNALSHVFSSHGLDVNLYSLYIIGSYYWTSTENDSSNACAVVFDAQYFVFDKGQKNVALYVHPFLAF